MRIHPDFDYDFEDSFPDDGDRAFEAWRDREDRGENFDPFDLEFSEVVEIPSGLLLDELEVDEDLIEF